VGSSRKYQAQNPEVHRAFTLVGDEMHNGAVLLPELLADGIRLLVYAGNAGERSDALKFALVESDSVFQT
jgi:hypothetical protein